jgi:HlyD family secretion protein
MIKRVIVPIVILLTASAAIWYLLYERTEQTPENELTVYGSIDVRLVNLGFDASGRIAEMTATEGAVVEAGDVLARLDTRRLELARDAAVAKATTQRERVRELEAGARPEELRKLEAELAVAKTNAANLERSYHRIRDLEKKALASSQQLEDTRTAAMAAADNVRAVEATLALARAGARKEEIAAAKAMQTAFDAEAGLAERNLEEAVLYAPADGIVQTRIMEPGDLVSPERPVYTLALPDPLWARVYLSETSLGKVRPGTPARVFNDSFPGKAYTGWVGYISPSAEFTPKSVQTEETRTDLVYQARVFVCNPQEELRLGMPVTVRLDLAAKLMAKPGCDRGSAP